jgi:hypothetical protein
MLIIPLKLIFFTILPQCPFGAKPIIFIFFGKSSHTTGWPRTFILVCTVMLAVESSRKRVSTFFYGTRRSSCWDSNSFSYKKWIDKIKGIKDQKSKTKSQRAKAQDQKPKTKPKRQRIHSYPFRFALNEPRLILGIAAL